MKHFYLLLITTFAYNTSNSQCPNPFGDICGNEIGISTNPSNPVNDQRPSKLNWFDFEAEVFQLNSSGTSDQVISSPYYSVNNIGLNHLYDPINGIIDNSHEQGWELIYEEFGINPDGSNKPDAAGNPFYVMYNKYNSILRVFVAVVDIIEGYDGAIISLEFPDTSPMYTNMLTVDSLLLPIAEPIQIDRSVRNVPAFTNANKKWFYGDFKIQYDPCTCFFQSRIAIRIFLTNTADIYLSSTVNGSITASDEVIAQNGINQTSSKSFSVNDFGNVLKKGYSSYNTLNKFKDELLPKAKKSNGSEDTDKKEAITNFSNAISNSNFLKAGLQSIPYVGAAVSLLSSFIGGGKTAPQEVTLTPMAINLQGLYTGTLAFEEPYEQPTFRNPGSDLSNTCNVNDNQYPYYNEVLGIFSMIERPKLDIIELVQSNPYGPPIKTTYL